MEIIIVPTLWVSNLIGVKPQNSGWHVIIFLGLPLMTPGAEEEVVAISVRFIPGIVI